VVNHEENVPGSTLLAENEEFLRRSKLPILIKDIESVSYSNTGFPDPLWDLHARISTLLTMLGAVLKSEDYPCPICASRTRDPEKIGVLTLHWDMEYDEYYPLSTTPYLTGTCADEPHSFGMIRPRSNAGMGTMLPFNHAEQINEQIDIDGRPEELGYILGAAQERRRLCEMLGIPVRRWGE
jgi:hypothetical protein